MNKPLVFKVPTPKPVGLQIVAMPLRVSHRVASEMIGVSERTLEQFVIDGRLPVVSLATSKSTKGRQQRGYAVSDLVAFIESAKSTNDKRPA